MEEKENFYHELDTKGKRSYCTCQTLLFGLIIVAIILAVGVAQAVKQVKTVVLPARQVVATRTDADQLQQKVMDLSKTVGASTSLTITEQELTSMLIEGFKTSPDMPLKGIQAEINQDAIIITGTATKYLNSSLAITVVPEVVDGLPRLELVKIQAGALTVPAQVTELIAKQLEGLLAQQLGQINGVTIKSIRLDPGRMTVTGTIKAQPGTDPTLSPS